MVGDNGDMRTYEKDYNFAYLANITAKLTACNVSGWLGGGSNLPHPFAGLPCTANTRKPAAGKLGPNNAGRSWYSSTNWKYGAHLENEDLIEI